MGARTHARTQRALANDDHDDRHAGDNDNIPTGLGIHEVTHARTHMRTRMLTLFEVVEGIHCITHMGIVECVTLHLVGACA